MINDCESRKNLKKIGYISAIVRILALIGFILFLGVELFGQISVEFSNKADTNFETGTVSRSASDILSRLPFQLSVVAAFYWTFQLFGGFRKGDIFTDFSVKAFRLLAISVLLIGINKMLLGIYKWGLETLLNFGQTADLDINVYSADVLMIGFGLFLYAIALVQREAKTRTDDLKLIF